VRLKAYRQWLKMEEPKWANVRYPAIDYQSIVYYSAPKAASGKPKNLADVDPELLRTYERLGIPLQEQALFAGVAVDAVFDSVSVATTFARAGRVGHPVLLVLGSGSPLPRAGRKNTSARWSPTRTTFSPR